MGQTVLNIAGGKISPLTLSESCFTVNVDTMYYINDDPQKVERKRKNWEGSDTVDYYINADIFEYMEKTLILFDRVCIYRFLEHVSFTQLLYFIYLVSTVTQQGSTVDVIVPNYYRLAQMIIAEDPIEPAGGNFEAHNILLTTELLNEPSCPHASIWTPGRAYYYWELERRFKIQNVEPIFQFDGRDIYMRFKAERI
jgi:hypothetical protein